MTNLETTDLRPLSDEEIDNVTGGILPWLAMGLAAASVGFAAYEAYRSASAPSPKETFKCTCVKQD